MVTDTVADLITRIRNAKDAKHKYVDVSNSKLNREIIEALKKKGYVQNYLVNGAKRQVRIFLKYDFRKRQSIIHGIKRVSKPGLRKYVGVREIPMVFSGLGSAILSTPKGVLDCKTAREERVGGELLFVVW
ncbi:30S ribosomal protein S8 [Candidatus Aerophobetes bacterium]|uniref:Small ribosomal subunit protein uS8 n=1 Tax=Aerophobetes bacterium TaxID=2030807 RepID=A0A2A4X8L9_UNCAE|nr:MAG: 30S ribosomal protein S8 [Candidatus Aerophobetes bacterium]